jgi:hypothetical protein
MPDDAMATPPDLGDDLRSYFAITTATELPRRVREMSARTLRPRRRSYGPLLGGGGAVLATAALAVVIVGLHHGTGGAGSTASGAAELPAKAAAPQATISYPGVDTSRLASAGDVLQPPAGHGTALVTAVDAQAAAAGRPGAGLAGPAVLAWAQLRDTSPPTSCLCWVVEVPIVGAASGGPAPTLPIHSVLVLVDATTGRLVDTLAVPGP